MPAYCVIPHPGPKDGRGPYKNRWTVEHLVLVNGETSWQSVGSFVCKGERKARARAAIFFTDVDDNDDDD